MAYQPVNTGASANDGTGDTLRVAFTKGNNNFAELYARPVLTADGTTIALTGTAFSVNAIPISKIAPGGSAGQVITNVNGTLTWATPAGSAVATASAVGVVKPGSTLAVASDGTLDAQTLTWANLTDPGALLSSDGLFLVRNNALYKTTLTALATLIGASSTAYATSFTMTQSSTGGATGVADTLTFTPVGGVWPNMTISLTVSGVTAALTNGSGGTLTQTTLTPPVGSSTPCTVIATPSTSGTMAVAATNTGGLSNPSNLSYTVSGTAATAYTLTQSSSSGTVGTLYTLTLTPTSGNWPANTVTLTLTGTGTATLSNGTGGSLSGNVLTLPNGTNTVCTVKVTPSAAGTVIATPTNSGSLTNPSAVTYTASAASGNSLSPDTGTTLIAAYDASVGSSVTHAVNGQYDQVSALADGSGNAHNLTLNGGGWIPVFQSNTPTSGLNLIYWDGGNSNSGLSTGDNASFLNGLQTNFTIVVAAKFTMDAAGNVLSLGNNGQASNYYLSVGTDGTFYWGKYTGATVQITGTGVTGAKVAKFVLRKTGSTIDIWFNGGTKITGTNSAGSDFVPSRLDIMGNPSTATWTNGGIGEVRIYSGAASDSWCGTTAMGYAVTKWGAN